MRIFIVGTILVFCCLIFGCNGWVYSVPAENMLPTIKVGDALIVNQFAYSSSPIERFDIVAFNAPESAKKLTGEKGDVKYVKRIIGLPNEKLEIRDNKIYINDELLNETFEKIVDAKDEKKYVKAIIIPANEYFLLGDNRPNSADSRYWEKPTIEKKEILGKVVQIIHKDE